MKCIFAGDIYIPPVSSVYLNRQVVGKVMSGLGVEVFCGLTDGMSIKNLSLLREWLNSEADKEVVV